MANNMPMTPAQQKKMMQQQQQQKKPNPFAKAMGAGNKSNGSGAASNSREGMGPMGGHAGR